MNTKDNQSSRSAPAPTGTTMFSLETAGMYWLVFDCKCMIVLRERSPREAWTGRPDILGITKHRYATEIEVKRSLADYRADSNKRHRRYPNLSLMPKYFYYLVPHDIACKIEVPDWAGLLTLHDHQIHPVVVKWAPKNKSSKRYSVKECVRIAFEITSFSMSLQLALDKLTPSAPAETHENTQTD